MDLDALVACYRVLRDMRLDTHDGVALHEIHQTITGLFERAFDLGVPGEFMERVGRWCPTPDKPRYRDQAAAEKLGRLIDDNPLYPSPELRWYRCRCGYVHLTKRSDPGTDHQVVTQGAVHDESS